MKSVNKRYFYVQIVRTVIGWVSNMLNESIRILRTAKQDHKKNLTNKLTDNSISSKDWWKFFKMCLGKDAKESTPPLSHNDKVINDPNEKADLFNMFFQSQSQLDDTNIIVPTLPAPTVTIDSIHLETQEIYSILKTLHVGKACGPDHDMINNRILREIADSVSPILTDILTHRYQLQKYLIYGNNQTLALFSKKMTKLMLEITDPFL